MRLTPIVERLKECGLRRVYGALELTGLKQHPGALPAYFVVPEGWRAGENTTTGVHDQLLREDFSVVLLLEGAARREDGVAEDLHAEEEKVIEALAAWTHPDASRACEASSGQLVSLEGHLLSWKVGFRTGRHIRKAT